MGLTKSMRDLCRDLRLCPVLLIVTLDGWLWDSRVLSRVAILLGAADELKSFESDVVDSEEWARWAWLW